MLRASSILLFFSFPIICYSNIYDNIPIVINTWNFTRAADKAWLVLNSSGTALDAVEGGASVCEYLQCDGTVGYGGSPDEHGETTLDALIMDGKTMNVGAVGNLRQIKDAISVARKVLENTKHSILVGESASNFAVMMGFIKETLTTNNSKQMWKGWKKNNCQPNFWQNVKPDPKSHCGPYSNSKTQMKVSSNNNKYINEYNHDTIGMVAIDKNGHIAAGTSTNGAKFKIPGRIGDSPIPGSGAYADDEVGGAAATGDGDIMLRFLPSLLAVEEMRRGSSPAVAAQVAIARIAKYYPSFFGGVIAVSKLGVHGAACNGMKQFPYSVHNFFENTTRVINVEC